MENSKYISQGTVEHFKYYDKFSDPKREIDFHLWNLPYTALHNHDYFEIFLVTKGPIRYICNGREYTLQKQSLVFVSPEDVHQFKNPYNATQQHVNLAISVQTAKRFCELISPNFFNKLHSLQNPLILELSTANYKWLSTQVKQINLARSDSSAQFSIIKNLLFNELSFLYAFLHSHNDSFPSWFNSLLEKINTPEYISSSATDLYDLCPYSPPIIINAFKQYLNQTPIQYLTERKIYYACNLLKNTDYTTLHISSLLGYDSLSHFNRTFKSKMNCTPREYRNKYSTK